MVVIARKIELLSRRAHSAWLVGALELVDLVDLVGQASRATMVLLATTARQLNYESSPVEPERLR